MGVKSGCSTKKSDIFNILAIFVFSIFALKVDEKEGIFQAGPKLNIGVINL
jgi:hypothetical protein